MKKKFLLLLTTLIFSLNINAQVTKELLQEELIRQEVPCHKIVLRQALWETGHFKSNLCRKYNNLFGIRTRNGYKHYDTWKDCVRDYKEKFSKRYKGGDYYAFLKKIKYAESNTYIQCLKKLKL